VWVLDQDVQMDLVGPHARLHLSGRFEAWIESALLSDPALIRSAARALALSNFPETVAPDVLTAAGLDPDLVLSSSDWVGDDGHAAWARRRDAGWRSAVL
jgi:putative restriction endonuclease